VEFEVAENQVKSSASGSQKADPLVGWLESLIATPQD